MDATLQRWVEAAPASLEPALRRDALGARRVFRRMPIDQILELLQLLEAIEAPRQRMRQALLAGATVLGLLPFLVVLPAPLQGLSWVAMAACVLAAVTVLSPLPGHAREWLLPLLYRTRHRIDPLVPAGLELDLRGFAPDAPREWCRLVLPSRQGPRLRITCFLEGPSSGRQRYPVAVVSVGLEDWEPSEDRVRKTALATNRDRGKGTWCLPVDEVVEMVEEVLAGERQRDGEEKGKS